MFNPAKEYPSSNLGLINSMPLGFTMMDDSLHEVKKKKKGKKKKRSKSSGKKQAYARLAFEYGVLLSRYDTLVHMTELAISAKRGRLDDDLLDSGLIALGRPRHRNNLCEYED